jgi:shikimate dehydrogenase
MTDKYAVLGHPISHSKSPLIHQAFAAETKQDLTYEALELDKEDFTGQLKQLWKAGYQGFNVTVPFKEDAYQCADQLSARAQRAGAVNTLKRLEDGTVYADTTDGDGLVNDISDNHGFDYQGKRILVLGAGGAVRGIIEPLLAKQPSEVVIANRTVSKAETIADIFKTLGNVNASGFDDLTGKFDLIINGTSASLGGHLPAIDAALLGKAELCYDMMYSNDTTVFNQWALDNDCKKVVDGLGMLVGQAAVSFELWCGVKPTTNPVIEKLRG